MTGHEDRDDMPSPQQMAANIIRAPFADDPVAVQLVDQIAAALDEAGLLIDPVENGMWRSIKDGSVICFVDDAGKLSYKLTDAGRERAADLIKGLAERPTEDDEGDKDDEETNGP